MDVGGKFVGGFGSQSPGSRHYLGHTKPSKEVNGEKGDHEMIRCVNCGGLSDDNALACKYCGRTFVDPRARMRTSMTENSVRTYTSQPSSVRRENRSPSRHTYGGTYQQEYMVFGWLVVMLLTGNLLLNFVNLIVLLIQLFY